MEPLVGVVVAAFVLVEPELLVLPIVEVVVVVVVLLLSAVAAVKLLPEVVTESLPDDPPPQALNNTDNIKPVNTKGGSRKLIALLKLNLLIFIRNTNPLAI